MGGMGHGRRFRLPLAIVVAVAAAGVATFLLRPRSGLIDPAAASAEGYFTAFQLERAEDFRGVQRMIGIGGLLVGMGTLALLAWRPPQLLGRLERRPLLGGLAAGAAISLLLVVVGLPLSAWAHQRAVEVGLSTQDWGPWLVDVAKAAAVGAAIAGAGGMIALALVRRFPRHWWAPAAVVVTGFAVVTIWLFPVVIDPIFNDFRKLPEGQLRSDVLQLADEAGVEVGEVYRVDASRRTTAANAYVNGLGNSKRVVLYDNLLSRFPRDEVRLVIAHELSHQKHRDLLRGLAWLALVAPAGTFLAQSLGERFSRRLREPGARPGPLVLPAIALAVSLVSFGLGIASNVLSRQVERRADVFSLELTRDPAAFIQLERRLALRNVTDPDPPGITHWLFGTHPTTLERIGIGEAWRANR